MRRSFLIDAGGRHLGYASDITRTYSASRDAFADLIDALDAAQRGLQRRVMATVLDADVGAAARRRQSDLLAGVAGRGVQRQVGADLARPHRRGVGQMGRHMLGHLVEATGDPVAQDRADLGRQGVLGAVGDDEDPFSPQGLRFCGQRLAGALAEHNSPCQRVVDEALNSQLSGPPLQFRPLCRQVTT